jgi:hypothetical protein
MDSSFTDRWMNKFRVITLSLIFSGALNIGLIAAFIVFMVQERNKTYSVQAPKISEMTVEAQNLSLLAAYSKLTFRELSSLLTNTDTVEDGFSKRDLALAALVSFHDFNLEKAIGAPPAQRRTLQLNNDAKSSVEIYPGLTEDQFQAILHFAYLEKWPLTAHGLFVALQKSPKPRDSALVQAFIVTPEFSALQALFQKTEAAPSPELLVDLACDGNWQTLDGFVREQSQMMDLSEDRRRRLILSYLALESPTAASLLLQTDFLFALKRLDDKGILVLIEHALPGELVQKFCIELLQSARSDAIWAKSAEILYRMANEEMPQPFDRAKAIARFAPAAVAKTPAPAPLQSAAPAVRETAARTHVVKEGESLWKIARQYHVKLDDLIAVNNLSKDRIKPGMTLKIPQGTGSKPPR